MPDEEESSTDDAEEPVKNLISDDPEPDFGPSESVAQRDAATDKAMLDRVYDETPGFDTTHTELNEKSRALLADTKLFWRSDSSEMSELKSAIRTLLSSLDADIPANVQGDSGEFVNALTRIDSEYDRVISACYAYKEHIARVKGAKHKAGTGGSHGKAGDHIDNR